MAKIAASVMVDSPVEEIWKFMTDWSNFPKMNPDIHEMRQTSTGLLGVGTTFEARLRQRIANVRVIEYEPYRKLTLEHASGPSKGTITIFSTETIEGRTRLTCTVDAKFAGFYKLVGPFAVGRAKKEVSAELGNVKRLVESEAKSQAM